MSMCVFRDLALAAVALVAFGGAADASVIVPGTADIWAWDGTPAPGDITTPPPAVDVSPVLAISDLSGIASVTFGVSGQTWNCPTCAGDNYLQAHDAGAWSNLPNLAAPINSLIGAWINPLDPSVNSAFEIGSGGLFFVPTGATELFLGSMDGYQWNNNGGAFTVDITENPAVSVTSFVPDTIPEPISLSLFGAGLAGAVTVRRRKTKAA
jgi:hypothetical protein